MDDQDAWLNQQEQQERQLSGNSNLRLQYHRTFGYFLAVSKAKASAVWVALVLLNWGVSFFVV